MLEREIEKKLVDGVRKLGGRAYKFVSPGNDGVPERIVLPLKSLLESPMDAWCLRIFPT